MNVVVLNGRLTKDPEVRATASGTTVTNFSIAVDRRFKREGQPDVDFFNCTAFGKTADAIGKYFNKGRMIVISGSLQNDSYTNKEGRKVTATSIVVDGFSFVDRAEKAEKPAEPQGPWMDIPDDVDDAFLPFN